MRGGKRRGAECRRGGRKGEGAKIEGEAGEEMWEESVVNTRTSQNPQIISVHCLESEPDRNVKWHFPRKARGGGAGCKSVAWQLWLSEPPWCLIILKNSKNEKGGFFIPCCLNALDVNKIGQPCWCACARLDCNQGLDRFAWPFLPYTSFPSFSSHVRTHFTYTHTHTHVHLTPNIISSFSNLLVCFHMGHQRGRGWEIKDFSGCALLLGSSQL